MDNDEANHQLNGRTTMITQESEGLNEKYFEKEYIHFNYLKKNIKRIILEDNKNYLENWQETD